MIASFALLLLLSREPAAVPVVPRGYAPPPSVRGHFCALALIDGLRRGRSLSVRSGPGLNYRRIDRLTEGERIYACNERDEWVGVVYARPGNRCGAPPGQSLDIRLVGACRSGWVHRHWVEMITG